MREERTPKETTEDLPLSNEVSSFGTEGVRECRWRVVDDGLELSDWRREDLWRVRVLSDGDFDDGETERPDVGSDRIGSEIVGVLSGEPFRLMKGTKEDKRKESAIENERTSEGSQGREGKVNEQPYRSRIRCSSWLSTSRAVQIHRNRRA